MGNGGKGAWGGMGNLARVSLDNPDELSAIKSLNHSARVLSESNDMRSPLLSNALAL